MKISIFDIHVIDVYFTSVYRNPSVFDTGSVVKRSNSKRELQNKQRLVKVNNGIFDIQIIDVYFTSIYSNPSVFDTSSVAKSSNSKQELQNEQRLVKGEVTMCVGSGSKIDMIIIAHSLYFRD